MRDWEKLNQALKRSAFIPRLKSGSSRAILITLQDWDKTVQATYGRPYSLQQQWGCMERGSVNVIVPCDWNEEGMRDSIPEFADCEEMGVKFATWLARDPKKPLLDQKYDFDLSLWWDRHFYPDVQAVANDLHKKGLLPPGEYSIKIDW